MPPAVFYFSSGHARISPTKDIFQIIRSNDLINSQFKFVDASDERNRIPKQLTKVPAIEFGGKFCYGVDCIRFLKDLLRAQQSHQQRQAQQRQNQQGQNMTGMNNMSKQQMAQQYT